MLYVKFIMYIFMIHNGDSDEINEHSDFELLFV